MNKTLQYLKTSFSEYYKTSNLKLPERFTRREWGFLFIGESFMQRHLAFKRSSDLIQFLTGQLVRSGSSNLSKSHTNVPAHVYYSSAYYSEPNLQPMQSKTEGWLGTDLIFDLDDDHLRNIEGLSQKERLDKVKDIVRKKLLDDFILGDFGFDEKYIKIAFSGSRGYHIHIQDPKIFKMTSPERRELVDYLIGIGLNMDRIFPGEVFDIKEYGGRIFSKKPKVVTPKLDSPGWKGRMARGIYDLLTNISKLPDDEGLDELINLCKNLHYKNKPVSLKDVEAIYKELFLQSKIKFNKETFEQRNVLEMFSRDQFRDIFLELVREHQKIEMAGETDEPVTTDVKRLIRMPTSLHGKTGFRVVPLTIEELRDFEPFRDAVAFDSEPVNVKIKINEPLALKLKGEEFLFNPDDDIIELPKFAAIYLICQQKAELA
jgi:DNA primase small subunit